MPTHLYVAPREGHQWGELRHLIFKANTELEWFERYAIGRDLRLGEGAVSRSRDSAVDASGRFDIYVKHFTK